MADDVFGSDKSGNIRGGQRTDGPEGAETPNRLGIYERIL